MRPVVDWLDKQYGQQVAFAGVDYNDKANKDLVATYRVRGYPTFVGYTAKADLEAAIKKAFGGVRRRAGGDCRGGS